MSSLGGGGGSSTSYGYLPYITPQAAQVIGSYQQNAANQAATAAQNATNAAMTNITQNYTSATRQLAPTSAAGYQAQLELNKYLGLNAVSPGTAPQAPPTAYAPTETDLRNYVAQNMGGTEEGKDQNAYYNYGGAGARYDNWSKQSLEGPASGQYLAGQIKGGLDSAVTNVLGQEDIRNAITGRLQSQYADQNKDLLAAKQAQYEQDLALYNQNKTWYDKYAAEGPYTQAQITENISNQPGYQAQQAEGLGAIQKAASARGLLGSGNMLKDLTNFASQLQGEYYNNTLNRLSQQAAAGTGAATSIAQALGNQGSALGGLQSQLGSDLGNAALAGGQAGANAYQLGNQQYRQVTSGQSSAGGGGLAGLGSALGGAASLASLFSSQELKDKVNTPSRQEILDRVESLNIDRWKYKEIDRTHMGPYAEEFKEAFGVGDGKSINLVDAIGVLFATVKALNQEIKDLKEAK